MLPSSTIDYFAAYQSRPELMTFGADSGAHSWWVVLGEKGSLEKWRSLVMGKSVGSRRE
jgi:hypothetical protein